MTDTIQTLLNEIQTAATDADYSRVETLLDELDDAYADRERSERLRREQARLARAEYDESSTESDRLTDYVQRGISMELGRAGTLGTLAAFAADPAQADTDRLVETLSSTADDEAEFAAATESVRSAIDGVQLPPKLAFSGVGVPEQPYLKGTTVPVTAVLANVGDAPTSVEVNVDPDGLALETLDDDLDTLGADEQAKIDVEVTATTAGSFTLVFEATSADAGSPVKKVDIEVQDKPSLVATLGTELDTLRSRLQDDDLNSGVVKSLDSKLANASKQFDRADAFIKDDRAKQANNAISTGINILGAFLNQLEGMTGDNRSDESRGGKSNGQGLGQSNTDTNGTGSSAQLPLAVAAALRARGRNLLELAVDARDAAI